MASTHVAGPVPVNASVPAFVAGTVVAVVLDPDPVELECDEEDDCDPPDAVGAGTNEMATVPCAPPASPNDRVHEAPAAIWAAVGGHG